MKKKVVHLLSSSSFSGAESVAINIIKSLEKEYEFVYVSPKGQIEKVLKENNINYIPLDTINPYTLNRLFKSLKPDVVHAHDFRASIKSSLSIYPCKKISHLHQNPLWIKSINKYSIAYAITCPIYSHILTVSSQIKEEAVFSKLSKNKMWVLENYINRDIVINKSKVNKIKNCYDIVYVGRLEEEKNPLMFIRLIAQLSIKNPNLKAAMIGNGTLFDKCKDLISELKLVNNIEMLGFLENPYQVMKKSKVLLMTSRWEGFGLVAVEAMILEKPVVANSVGGLKSIINDEVGKLCNTEEEYLAELTNLLENREYYEKKSKNASKYSEKYTGLQKFKSFLRQIYDYSN